MRIANGGKYDGMLGIVVPLVALEAMRYSGAHGGRGREEIIQRLDEIAREAEISVAEIKNPRPKGRGFFVPEKRRR